MNQVKIFENADFGSIRTIEQDGKVLFCGRDIATALGYANPNKALSDHCKGVPIRYPLQTPGGMQEIRFIAEGDVYRLITHSRLPAAEQFEQWVFDEILPTIRRNGYYVNQGAETAPENDQVKEILMKMIQQQESFINNQRELIDSQHKTIESQADMFNKMAEMFTKIFESNIQREQGVPNGNSNGKTSNVKFPAAPGQLITMTDVAQALGISRKIFINMLVSAKIVYKTDGGYKPFDGYIQNGYMSFMEFHSDKTGSTQYTVKITEDGFYFLADKFG